MRIRREQELRKAFRTLSECFLELGDEYYGLRKDQIARELFFVPGHIMTTFVRDALNSHMAPHE